MDAAIVVIPSHEANPPHEDIVQHCFSSSRGFFTLCLIFPAAPDNSLWCDWCSAEPDTAVATLRTHETGQAFPVHCSFSPSCPYFSFPWGLRELVSNCDRMRNRDGVRMLCLAEAAGCPLGLTHRRLSVASSFFVTLHLDDSFHYLPCRHPPRDCLTRHLSWLQLEPITPNSWLQYFEPLPKLILLKHNLIWVQLLVLIWRVNNNALF